MRVGSTTTIPAAVPVPAPQDAAAAGGASAVRSDNPQPEPPPEESERLGAIRKIVNAGYAPNPDDALASLALAIQSAHDATEAERPVIHELVVTALGFHVDVAPEKCWQFIKTQSEFLGSCAINSKVLALLVDRVIIPAVSRENINDIEVVPRDLNAAMTFCTSLLSVSPSFDGPLEHLTRGLATRNMFCGPWNLLPMLKAIPHETAGILLAQDLAMRYLLDRPRHNHNGLKHTLDLAGFLGEHNRDTAVGVAMGRHMLYEVNLMTKSHIDSNSLGIAFNHPSIPRDSKVGAASLLVKVLTSDKSQIEKNSFLINAALPYMTQRERSVLAHAVYESTNRAVESIRYWGDHWGRDTAETDWRSVCLVNDLTNTVCNLVDACADDESTRSLKYSVRELSEDFIDAGMRCNALGEVCAAQARLIRLDPENALNVLPGLLETTSRLPLARNGWRLINNSEHVLNHIAVATFLADPDGRAYIPGTEFRDGKENPLNDQYIIRGQNFTYPPSIAARRAELMNVIDRRPAVTQIFEAVPGNVFDLALMEQVYQGPPVQSSQWPALLAHLEARFQD